MRSRTFFFLLLFFVFSCSAVFAQDRRISILPEYSIPGGQLDWMYKTSPGIQLKYSSFSSSSGTRHAVGVSLGYVAFQPKADTLYFVVDHGVNGRGVGVGRAMLSSLQFFQVGVHYDFYIKLSDRVFLTPGAAFSAMYGRREMVFEDDLGAYEGSNEGGTPWAGLIPKIGLEYMLSDSFSIAPYISYSFLIQAGSTDESSINYSENTGAIYYYYSTGISINYSF
jgi:hypothetical protein